ncbi:MAG: hypothetical protein QXU18_02610 [Thermoplasmatales archaeon]
MRNREYVFNDAVYDALGINGYIPENTYCIAVLDTGKRYSGIKADSKQEKLYRNEDGACIEVYSRSKI